ncbi:MAG: hypothetical protein OER21_02415 [Gemmatimonadota bacterium]|nr:hypothetical protein [Gemmatimonadota bacterium]
MKRNHVIPVVLAAALAACTEANTPGRNAAVQVSFATQAVTPPLAASLAGAVSDTIVTGTDTLILSSVEVVLREIELKRVETPDCVPDNDLCEKFEAGPVLVSLPLTPGAEQRFGLDSVPAASYREIELDVHKPDDGDPQDQAFIAANPDFAAISIRVRGTFNGQAFEFTSDLDVEQKLPLTPVLVVAQSTSINITVFVDVGTWFLVNAVVVDPASANKGGPNEGVVKENIKNSFRAFEDDDRSGSGD